LAGAAPRSGERTRILVLPTREMDDGRRFSSRRLFDGE
jgi:hypothetical protein